MVKCAPKKNTEEESRLQRQQQSGAVAVESRKLISNAQRSRVHAGLVGFLLSSEKSGLVVEDLVGKPMILRNHGIRGRHWVSFELSGTKSNRLAIGAKIKIVSGGMTQTDEIHSGGSYLSQNDMRVHFGLGSAAKIDRVEIRWPSGTTDILKDLGVNRFYAVSEGRGIVVPEEIKPSPVRPIRHQ